MGYMKHVYFLLALFFALSASAQKNFSYIDEYRFAERKGEEKMVILAMPIGRSDIISFTGDTAFLRSAGPLIIDIVCTDYPSDASLTALNQKRFRQVFQTFPFLKKNSLQQVNFYRQLNGNTAATASKMFHGLIIKFRTIQDPNTIKHDLDKLDELLSLAIPAASPEKEEDASSTIEADEHSTLEFFRKNAKISSNSEITVYQDGPYVLVDPRQAVTDLQLSGKLKTDSVKLIRGREIYSYFKPGSPYTALLQKSNVEVPLIITDKKDWFKTVIADAPKKKARNINIDSIGKTGYAPSLPDSTILKTFQRNNNSWNNVVVLADVTGSMYPYSAQILIWVKQAFASGKKGRFVFFNDGDRKKENEKQIGSTGGIYSQVCSTFEEAKELLKTTMRNGNGGDAPENDIEALLKAEKDYPDATANILIADNWAPVKDKMLITKLNKPVNVILCGVYERVNTDYLDLARLTKGSVHLADKDFFNIATMNEGEILKLGNYSYKIVNGSFTDTTDEKTVFKKP